jgi:ABC transport system ATP-binding/permease protein
MFKLVIADDEGKTTVVPLVREEISIGRKEGNTIRLTERNVSRKHARLRRANGSFLIEDLSSFNGVKVNGRKIGGELELSAGDQITIGDYQLALQVEGTTDAGATMPDTTAPSLLGGGGAPTEVTAMIAAPTSGITPARLVMLSPPAPGQEFALNRPRMKLGRAEDLDVWVNHRSISREHAEFIVDGDRFAVTDLGSANGLRVNGVDTKRHELRSGDVIEIGQVKLRFVAPGETFVFDEGRTMQMDALSDLGPSSPNRTPMYVAGGIVVLALLGGVGVAMSGGDDPGPTVTAIPAVPTAVPPAAPPGSVGSVPGTVPSAGTPVAPVGVDVAGAVAACRTALNSGDFEGALTQANLALSAAPADPGAIACRDAVTNQRAESDAFATGLAALRGGDLQGAYVSFESLPEGSTYRNRAEFSQVMHDFAEENLRTAESLVSSDAGEASRLAQMVLTMSVIEPSARARAEAVVRRARPHVASSGGGGSRGGGGGGGGGGGPVRVAVGGGGGGGSSVAPPGGGGGATSAGGGGGGTVEATAPAESSRYDSARACAMVGDHGCVIRELRGHCTVAREYELLIAAMRASTGYDREIESSMRAYVTRFPTGRQVSSYRQYLVAHSGG